MPRKPHKYCLPRFSLPCFSLSCFGKPKQAQCSYVLERAMGIESVREGITPSILRAQL